MDDRRSVCLFITVTTVVKVQVTLSELLVPSYDQFSFLTTLTMVMQVGMTYTVRVAGSL